MRMQTLLSFLTGAYVALQALDAHAYTRLMAAGQCYELIGGDQDHGIIRGPWGEYSEEGRDALLVCPVIDDANGPKTSITAYGIDGYFQNPANTFMVPCVKYYGGVGGACGVRTYSSGGSGIKR